MVDFNRDILAPVADDFAAMDHFIQTGINSKVPLVMTVSQHVVEAGGKRMRPALVLLAGGALGYQGTRHHEMAGGGGVIH